jgi:peptide-methionine (S)-S-oxide reductase
MFSGSVRSYLFGAATVGALVTGVILAMSGAEESRSEVRSRTSPDVSEKEIEEKGLQKATFGGGCFWCTEAVFKALKGVHSVESGYSGGHVENPTYKDVCTGTTGHAEVVQVVYDPKAIPYEELLEVFWRTHDPTTRDRQGNDVGPQYRSVVFYHDEQQQKVADVYKKKLNDAKAFGAPIVTEISPLENYYPAEDYHQDYFELNGREPYCQFVIAPKMEKFKKVFAEKLKDESETAKSE